VNCSGEIFTIAVINELESHFLVVLGSKAGKLDSEAGKGPGTVTKHAPEGVKFDPHWRYIPQLE
jgi:hypothetical protein